MSATADFPYDTRLDVPFGPLERFDVNAVRDAAVHPWFNQSLVEVNDSVVRVGVVRGEYHWHHHDNDDEMFYVVEGRLLVDIRDQDGERSLELKPGQGVVVPKGVVHRTRAEERTVMLMVETRAIVPTGDN